MNAPLPGHTPRLILALAEGVAYETEPRLLRGPGSSLPLSRGAKAWDALAAGTSSYDDLLDLIAAEAETSAEIASSLRLLRCAEALRLVEYRLWNSGNVLGRLKPARAMARDLDQVDISATWTVSRFTLIERGEHGLVAENPRYGHQLTIQEPALAGTLAAACCAKGPLIGNPGELAVLRMAAAAGVLVDAEEAEAERTPPLAYWEATDLRFVIHTRSGAHHRPLGASFPWCGVTEPIPALKAPDPLRPRVLLPPADSLPPISLAEVIERRTSIREHQFDRHLDIGMLSTFLWHAARVTIEIPRDDARGLYYDVAQRPYPGAGASYELEIYVTACDCEGLAPGVYWYDPKNHHLELRSDKKILISALIDTAIRSAALSHRPQALLSITSRLPRLAWKYRGISLAVTLKNTGVLFHQFYLIATALGLAPCALGTGDSPLVNLATQTDPIEEAPVGEFILGGGPSSPLAFSG